jgi:hypothetical protein
VRFWVPEVEFETEDVTVVLEAGRPVAVYGTDALLCRLVHGILCLAVSGFLGVARGGAMFAWGGKIDVIPALIE